MTEDTTGRPGGLAKAYMPAAFEAAIYERWLAADVFAPDGAGSRADPSKPPFVITQPPPNITGALHIGHALTSTVEDAMIRRARMLGRPTLWLPGLDHASIAAQFVLDRMIAAEGETRESLGRERYLERMWQFINETREVMLGQQRRIGASLDWSRLRFTMDEGSARAVRESVRPAVPRGPRLPDRGAHQLVPGLPDERQRPGGHPDPRDGHDLDDPLPPDRRGDRERRRRRDDRRRHHPSRDDPRRHGGRRPPGRPALRGARRAARPDPVRRARRVRSSPTTAVERDFGTARSRSPRPTTTTTTRPAAATACR